MKIKVNPNHAVLGGIGSVVADHKILLNNHTFVERENDADLIINHASAESHLSPDITYTHGIYPTQDKKWTAPYSQINKKIFENIANSLQVAAVSTWGGGLIKRYCGIQPHIIHNGIFYNEYKRGGSKTGPVLWGKTSINPVCDPTDFNILTERVKDNFVSFVDLPHTHKIKPLQRTDLKSFLRTCSLLVATTKENDSLLIMEAMASGIPVLAYDWGMAKERLTHKQGCYLVSPHNLTELLNGYAYLKQNWQLQSEIAHTVAGWFDWELQKPKLERLLDQTLREKEAPNTVSIIIPCHNYGAYVKQAIHSAKNQTVPCEVIVVDDGSTDNSLQVILEQKPDQVITHNTAQGVSVARNKGIEKAKGSLIVCLDADDVLEPSFVETMLTGFTKRKVAICFSPLKLIDEHGNALPHKMFTRAPDIVLHKQGQNQVPSCCMFRKSWWARADGYDHFLSFTEDANLWLKMFLLDGIAVRVTQEALVNYRRHSTNNSLKPGSPWLIFHEHKVISDDSLTFVLVGDSDDLNIYHAYWRLKELPYGISVYNEGVTKPTKNFIILSPTANIQELAMEKLNTWTQLFSYQPA